MTMGDFFGQVGDVVEVECVRLPPLEFGVS